MALGGLATIALYKIMFTGFKTGLGVTGCRLTWGQEWVVFALVLIASMPVEKLPLASWPTALGLGFLSAVFDNIPLTALALKQGGYDWGFLAYTVGFGGSMIWFGSSSGVALSNVYPEARSVGQWLRHGWYIVPAYVIGFFVMLWAWSWHPDARLGSGVLKTEGSAQRSTK